MIRFALACALLCSTSAASAADLVLKLKYPPNTKRVYQVEQKTDQTLTIGAQDVKTVSTTFLVQNQAVGDKKADGSVEIVEKLSVLQNELKLPNGLGFQFDSANPDKATDNPALEPVAKLMRALFKTPVTQVIDAEGKVSEVRFPEGTVEQLDEDFRSMFDADRRKKAVAKAMEFIPTGAVKPGDMWEHTMEADLGAGQTLTITSELTYKGTMDSNGKTLHRIASKPKAVSYAMDPNSKSPLKVTESELKPTEGEGEILFDAEAGDVHQRQSKLRIEGPLKLEFGGQQIPGKLDLTLTEKTTRQP